MDLQLQDDVAVVLGGAHGLGLAIARAFADEGSTVVLADLDPGVASAARSLGDRARGHCLDATDYAQVQGLAGSVRRDFGRCDHVAFAVGVGSGKFGFPFWNLEPGDWDRVLRINLIAAANAAHAFGPAMAEAGRGTILFLSSIAGQIGSQTDPPYSAAKAGLINFAQCAARDMAPFGVRVNTICPGMVKTTLNRAVYEAWAARQASEGRPTYEAWAGEKIRKLVPLGRWQEPEDVAAMAVFLASPRAKNVTGQTINVDGGFVMHW